MEAHGQSNQSPFLSSQFEKFSSVKFFFHKQFGYIIQLLICLYCYILFTHKTKEFQSLIEIPTLNTNNTVQSLLGGCVGSLQLNKINCASFNLVNQISWGKSDQRKGNKKNKFGRRKKLNRRDHQQDT